MPPAIDITNQRFGSLVALERVGVDKGGNVLWRCVCDCDGKEIMVRGYSLRLRSGGQLGCGSCPRGFSNNFKHGHSAKGVRTPTYDSYSGAEQRCNNPNSKDYPRWGGRGIEFRFNSFDQWLEELGERPEGMTVDRIDNDGHYEPGNVRWATPKQQANNRRSQSLAECEQKERK